MGGTEEDAGDGKNVTETACMSDTEMEGAGEVGARELAASTTRRERDESRKDVEGEIDVSIDTYFITQLRQC